ncbi:MAG: FecR domain-containing protein [Bacteroidales bacterium]|nr:FecR domain-containing protein [Bacteroidales bacterium]
MDKPATYYETLITSYLLGEAGAEDVSELNKWLAEDTANLQLFTEYRDSWALQEANRIESSTDLDSEWAAFAERTGMVKETVSRKLMPQSRRRFIRVAAVLLLFIVPSLIYFWFFMNPGEDMLYADKQVVESTLPDGTQVSLNAGSSLHYPSRFKGDERKVSLEGEAFFDVTYDKEKAFVIDANEMQIRVLGTSFYVNTHSDDNTMEVVLISGSVQLDYNNKQMLLEPGNKAIVLKQHGEIVKQQNKDPNLLAWKTKKLCFDDTSLSEIIDVLKKVYHKDITVLNPEILNCRITATFEGQSLETVLLVLQSTIDITARPNGDKIELSGKGCQ